MSILRYMIEDKIDHKINHISCKPRLYFIGPFYLNSYIFPSRGLRKEILADDINVPT